jgi:hypothetical protein
MDIRAAYFVQDCDKAPQIQPYRTAHHAQTSQIHEIAVFQTALLETIP